MNYRTLGRTGRKVSEISLGTEYLIDIPEKQAVKVIHAAIDRGVNYFDLFFAQPGFRDTMARAFRGHRDKVMLAAHLGASHKDGQYERTRDIEEALFYVDDFLARYRTDYADVLFLHNSDGQQDFDFLMKPGGFYEQALRLKKEGKCRFIGFSGHTVDTALLAAGTPEIDIIMFPINLAAHAVPGKADLLTACEGNDIGLVAMKPYAGGRLLQSGPRMELDNWASAGGEYALEKKSPVSAAQCLSYILAQRGVSCIVPGCASVEHLNDALAWYDNTPEQNDFAALLSEYNQYTPGECTYCNHCLPCPVGIDIGRSIRLGDRAAAGLIPGTTDEYNAMAVPPSECIRCGDCEDRCPFGVAAMDRLAESAALFAG